MFSLIHDWDVIARTLFLHPSLVELFSLLQILKSVYMSSYGRWKFHVSSVNFLQPKSCFGKIARATKMPLSLSVPLLRLLVLTDRNDWLTTRTRSGGDPIAMVGWMYGISLISHHRDIVQVSLRVLIVFAQWRKSKKRNERTKRERERVRE